MNNFLVVFDRIGNYHQARIEAFGKAVAEAKVYCAELSGSDKLYKWDKAEMNNYFTLSQRPAEENDFFHRFKKFRSIIKTCKIKYCCLCGYGRLEYIAFALWARLKRVKIVMFCESWYGEKSLKNFFKSKFLKFTTCGMLVSGSKAKKFVTTVLNFPADKVETPYSTVDNDHFKSVNGYSSASKTMLCVARYSPEKNLFFLIDAFRKSNLNDSWKLTIVGGGPQKDELLTYTSQFDNITLIDWAAYNDLPAIYSQASFFVLASTFEPWGLVVNEAMAAGLPVTCSVYCGCVPDLVRDGVNGYVFDSLKQESAIEVFNRISQLNDNNLKSLSDKSLKIIEDFTLEIWTQKILKLYAYNKHC